MSSPEERRSREADEAVRRIHDQMELDGKLDKARTAEGVALFMVPVALGVAYGVSKLLGAAGLSDEARVLVGAAMLVALAFGGIYLLSRSGR